jgi:hypothetical protein
MVYREDTSYRLQTPQGDRAADELPVEYLRVHGARLEPNLYRFNKVHFYLSMKALYKLIYIVLGQNSDGITIKNKFFWVYYIEWGTKQW